MLQENTFSEEQGSEQVRDEKAKLSQDLAELKHRTDEISQHDIAQKEQLPVHVRYDTDSDAHYWKVKNSWIQHGVRIRWFAELRSAHHGGVLYSDTYLCKVPCT